eukprot:CAMPEP_0178692358 /NCGR_PEP_ID=MMETSP0699-20121125/7145_1 /TAXON_ID=265572 /ORGANISM="Extubocellulus spinifer, Strain CCMP396" /LENGTH=31 /DNA_ID= /DNA_START= /DNA_END= /DNA_ORIENTATION=
MARQTQWADYEARLTQWADYEDDISYRSMRH